MKPQTDAESHFDDEVVVFGNGGFVKHSVKHFALPLIVAASLALAPTAMASPGPDAQGDEAAQSGADSAQVPIAAPVDHAEHDPATACSDLVDLAPVLDSDLSAQGAHITPAPTADGRTVPVVLVHGWVSVIDHDEGRTGYFSHYVDRTANGAAGTLLADSELRSSLIGMLQQVPGAQVYTFDYSQVGSRWVTDPEIGPKLAHAIECLSDASGHKPVLVSHSMGGLAIRQALSEQDSAGQPISERVNTALAFAPPSQGSDVAALGANVMETGSQVPIVGLPLRLAWEAIGRCSEHMDATNTTCSGIKVLDAFQSSGGRALRTGSPELAALPWWPEDVHLTTYVGDIQLGGVTLFGHSSARLVDAGDLLVSEESAVAGADQTRIVRCEYGIVSAASAKTGLQRVVLLPKGSSVDRPATLLSTPCWHEALLHETTLTNAAMSDLGAAIAQDTSWPVTEQ